MTNKYTPKYRVHQIYNEPTADYPGKRGRKAIETTWENDRYYALLKHRAQARYRGELHEITPEQWAELWPKELWDRKGRSSTDLALFRRDLEAAWTIDNTVIDENQNKGQYYSPNRRMGRPRGSKNRTS